MISVCLITFNEEENIKECLESIKWADEIIVVDSGSTDRTLEICKEYTDKVFIHPWEGYVTQKNIAISKVTGDWILAIDADERVGETLLSQIKKAILDDKYDGYLICRKTYYLNRWIKHGDWYPNYKLRLIKKGKGKWVGDALHERLEVEGRVGKLKGELLHFSYKNFSDHVSKINHYTTIAASEMKKKGKKFRISSLIFRPIFKFIRSYILRGGFLDGFPGFAIAVLSSYSTFLKYIKLFELINIQKKGREVNI